VYDLAVYNLAGHLLVEYCPDQTYPLAAVSWSGNLATVTTSGVNAIQPGDTVALNGLSPAAFNGAPAAAFGFKPIVVAAVDPVNNRFSYPLAPQPVGTPTVLPNAAAVVQYFAALRRNFKIGQFVPGMIASTNDSSTGMSLDNPDFMKGLTLYDLQVAKTPWGRAYLAIAQKAGPNLWGLS
jgi:hypothetical protein